MALFSKTAEVWLQKGAPEHEKPRWKSGIFTWMLDARVAHSQVLLLLVFQGHPG